LPLARATPGLRKLLSKGSNPTPGVRFTFPVALKGPAPDSPATSTQTFSGDLLMLIAGNCRQVGRAAAGRLMRRPLAAC
jgi:hypothetical protein